MTCDLKLYFFGTPSAATLSAGTASAATVSAGHHLMISLKCLGQIKPVIFKQSVQCYSFKGNDVYQMSGVEQTHETSFRQFLGQPYNCSIQKWFFYEIVEMDN
ncbi:unnamed protein product [Amaranthus hypochondriacus]